MTRNIYDWKRILQNFIGACMITGCVIGAAAFYLASMKINIFNSQILLVITIGLIIMPGLYAAKNSVIKIDKQNNRLTYPILISLLTTSVEISDIEDVAPSITDSSGFWSIFSIFLGTAAQSISDISGDSCNLNLIGKFGTITLSFTSPLKAREAYNAIRWALDA